MTMAHDPTRGGPGVSRRAVLKGLGVTMALPWLESAAGGSARAAGLGPGTGPGTGVGAGVGVGGPPVRMACVFAPNGVHYPSWAPSGAGRDYALSETLRPLDAVREHVNVLTGLTLDKARANGDGPGDHARSSATFLTGRQARKTAGNDISLGVSVDQFAAAQVGARTRLPSLELGCENGRRAGSCDSGYSCAYSSNIAWRDEDTPVPKIVDPAAAFERLFGGDDAAAARERISRRQSILDFVKADARRLERRLGAADRRKLDEYQTSVREVERRVRRLGQDAADAAPPPGARAPAGIPREVGAHVDLMYDMLMLAFQTDQTRISTLMVGVGGSNRAMPEIGVSEGHHHLSHHRGDEIMIEKIRRIDRFYVERFARFVQRMAETPEGDGSLLDHCMILYGSGISDGNRHNHEDLPIVLAGGGAGTIATGSLVRYPRDTPLCNLYVSLLERMGCDVGSFGDSTAPLALPTA